MDQAIQNIPPEIRQFLESLLEEVDIHAVDEKMKEDIIQELFYQLDNYLASVIADNLLPEELEIFIKMNEEKKSKEEMEAFMKEKIPNAQEIFTKAFAEFRKLYLENIETARDNQEQPK